MQKFLRVSGILGSIILLTIIGLWLYLKQAIEWDGSYKNVSLVTGNATSSFNVPSHTQIVDQSLLVLNMQYPTGNLVQVKRSNEEIRIVVQASEPSKMRSSYLLEKSRGKLKQEGRFMAFSETIGGKEQEVSTYYVHTDNLGYHALVIDKGAWASVYRVYRPLSNTIELDYLFSKKIGLENFEKVDALVVKTVNQHRSDTK